MGFLIRKATIEDIDWLCELSIKHADMYQKATKYKVVKDKETLKVSLEYIINEHFILIAEGEISMAGYLVGIYSNFMWNPDVKTCSQIAWFVDPKCRGKGVGKSLCEGFLAEAKKNADVAIFGNLNSKDSQKQGDQLKNWFDFKLIENSYWRDL